MRLCFCKKMLIEEAFFEGEKSFSVVGCLFFEIAGF